MGLPSTSTLGTNRFYSYLVPVLQPPLLSPAQAVWRLNRHSHPGTHGKADSGANPSGFPSDILFRIHQSPLTASPCTGTFSRQTSEQLLLHATPNSRLFACYTLIVPSNQWLQEPRPLDKTRPLRLGNLGTQVACEQPVHGPGYKVCFTPLCISFDPPATYHQQPHMWECWWDCRPFITPVV